MYPLRLLLDLVPELLVEWRKVSRPGRAAAGLSLAHRQPRRDHAGTPRRPGRPVQALSLPHHHELRKGLPQGPEPGQGDRRNQEDDGRTQGGLSRTPSNPCIHKKTAGFPPPFSFPWNAEVPYIPSIASVMRMEVPAS